MSNDYYVVSGDSLRDVADSIRTKGGTSAQLEFPNGWKNAIDDIETGGGSSASAGDVWQDANGFVHLASEASGGDEVPADGKTRIWIHIADETPDNRLTFYLRFTASTANNTTVDWGDGTIETLGATYADNYPHKYPSGGDYVITMTVNSGMIYFSGASIYGAVNTANFYNRLRITQIVFGNDISSIGSSALIQCYSVTSVVIPDSVSSIESNAFQDCYSLMSITIPDNVTNIASSAFSNCFSMSEYHFKPTTPPTLASANVFNSIASDCVIYVPQGSLDAYKTATNWSTYASKMQEEPT